MCEGSREREHIAPNHAHDWEKKKKLLIQGSVFFFSIYKLGFNILNACTLLLLFRLYCTWLWATAVLFLLANINYKDQFKNGNENAITMCSICRCVLSFSLQWGCAEFQLEWRSQISVKASRTNTKTNFIHFKYKAKHKLTNDKWFNGCMNLWECVGVCTNVEISLHTIGVETTLHVLGILNNVKDKLTHIF